MVVVAVDAVGRHRRCGKRKRINLRKPHLMKWKLGRLAKFIDRFGLFSGMKLYLQVKRNKVDVVRLPGFEHPVHLRPHTSDVPIFDQVFLYDEYGIDIPFVPKVVVDAGANIGLFTVAFKNRFPDAGIFCIEPDADNLKILRRNTAALKHVQIIEAGLWPCKTRLTISDPVQIGHSGLMVTEDPLGEVPAITLNDIMQDFGLTEIDVLKIDIECSEYELFTYGFETWLPKVRMIIIELHDELRPGCSQRFFQAIARSWAAFRYAQCGENTMLIQEL